MEIFFHKLVKVLDKEKEDWRMDTEILLDNSKYHTAIAIMKVFKDLRIPLCSLVPTSMMCAPVSSSLLPLSELTSTQGRFAQAKSKYL